MPFAFGRPGLRAWAPVAFSLLFALAGCRQQAPRRAPVETMMAQDSSASDHIGTIIATQSGALMELPGVHGVAEGRTPDGKPCILLLVDDPAAPGLPRSIEGFPVVLHRTGPIRALPEEH